MSIKIVTGAAGLLVSAAAAAFVGAPHIGASQAAASLSTTPSTATGSSTNTSCDGNWSTVDGHSVQGRPEGLDRGDTGAVYLWHDSDGWHLRATDRQNDPHRYSGTITLSDGVKFTDLNPVLLERDDKLSLSGDTVLHYSFTTYNGIDGFDFRVGGICKQDNARIQFTMDYNGREMDTNRIIIGAEQRHPDRATFSVVRDR